ncbi:MAG: hypothetical protein LBH25_05030 [Fibromonadaceae bacterium]|jgi:hypothetical protein|nr:hypothetical protein [Fibromonadaceae bacterium]
MKNMLFFFMLLLGACASTEEEPHYGDGFGELKREGYKTEMNCFQILKKSVEGLVAVDAPTIIKEDADDYLPLKLLGSPYVYTFSLKVPAKYYTEEEYLISLRALKIDFKRCGEAKEVTFFRYAEEDGIAEYRSHIQEIEGEVEEKGKYIFLAQKEMPSYDWYDVLNVCVNESKKFRLEGVVLNE